MILWIFSPKSRCHMEWMYWNSYWGFSVKYLFYFCNCPSKQKILSHFRILFVFPSTCPHLQKKTKEIAKSSYLLYTNHLIIEISYCLFFSSIKRSNHFALETFISQNSGLQLPLGSINVTSVGGKVPGHSLDFIICYHPSSHMYQMLMLFLCLSCYGPLLRFHRFTKDQISF